MSAPEPQQRAAKGLPARHGSLRRADTAKMARSTSTAPSHGKPPPAHACADCQHAVARGRKAIYEYTHATGRRSLHIACACDGREPSAVYEHHSDQAQEAASLAKLAWTLAAVKAHTAGDLDLTTPVPHSELSPSRHRDIANILEINGRTSHVTLLALGLSTSSNPIFDHLARNPIVQEAAKEITGVTLTSGFSDEDLHQLVRTNLITSRAAVQLLHAITQQAVGPLEPISLGLINSMRTSRLVRDIDTIEGLPDNLVVANKTGTLNGVRNDAALMSSGTSCLGVCALSQGNRNGHAVDNDMAQLGRALTQARFA